ncbi:hypothetical protein E2562_037800 [Oryza meyeriana var. granulata]|uniref:Uncharacterized protein n=1 Tax=Oryza meyeriana var. granulata TaxID=110450 RepID=A0A6G1E915_9ORYZ|nr:hypothetical protein E2562_037800 [Oryza meyeriana var. granulata]
MPVPIGRTPARTLPCARLPPRQSHTACHMFEAMPSGAMRPTEPRTNNTHARCPHMHCTVRIPPVIAVVPHRRLALLRTPRHPTTNPVSFLPYVCVAPSRYTWFTTCLHSLNP